MAKGLVKTKKIELNVATPPDLVQMTILVDNSGSMDEVWHAATEALQGLRKNLALSLLSVQTFNESWRLVKDFDSADDTEPDEPCGGTNLYGALLRAIQHSRDVAQLTPEYKAHHVFVVITDGMSNEHTPDEYDEAKKEIKKMDVEATFLMLDSSHGQKAGKDLNWVSTKFDNTPASIIAAVKKVQAALEKITDNVDQKLPPTAGLQLPPAQ